MYSVSQPGRGRQVSRHHKPTRLPSPASVGHAPTQARAGIASPHGATDASAPAICSIRIKLLCAESTRHHAAVQAQVAQTQAVRQSGPRTGGARSMRSSYTAWVEVWPTSAGAACLPRCCGRCSPPCFRPEATSWGLDSVSHAAGRSPGGGCGSGRAMMLSADPRDRNTPRRHGRRCTPLAGTPGSAASAPSRAWGGAP